MKVELFFKVLWSNNKNFYEVKICPNMRNISSSGCLLMAIR